MFFARKTRLYFCPHQDDELLTMGIDIHSAVLSKNNVHVILCTDGSQSSVRKKLNNGKSCSKHPGTHIYDLSIEEFVQARDREFIGSCTALGVRESNIHIPQKRDIDGSLSVKNAEDLIMHYLSVYGRNAVVCTVSPNNGPSQHQDHKTLGIAASNLLRQGILKEVHFFIEPYLFEQIKDDPQLVAVEPTITQASVDMKAAIDAAIHSYSCWNPEEHRYAVGYHSVPTEFDDFLEAPKNYSFVEWNPKAMNFFQRRRLQHQK